MPIMWPHEAAFLRLQGKPSLVFRNMTKQDAHEFLKKYTGQDFGYDVAAWQEWFDNDPKFSQMIPFQVEIYNEIMRRRQEEVENEASTDDKSD